jgi:hypothetical protein
VSASAPDPKRGVTALLSWIPAALYTALIWYLSSRALSIKLDFFPLRDKGVHFVEYGLLALLVRLALQASWPRARAPNAAAIWITLGLGLMDELHQLYVPGRSGDALDLLADGCGASFATWLYTRVRHQERVQPVVVDLVGDGDGDVNDL